MIVDIGADACDGNELQRSGCRRLEEIAAVNAAHLGADETGAVAVIKKAGEGGDPIHAESLFIQQNMRQKRTADGLKRIAVKRKTEGITSRLGLIYL